MPPTPTAKPKRPGGRARGVSLIEGMVASAVLLIGLVGVLQGIGVASMQNSIANRMTRGGAIARQVSAGLLAQGRARLTEPGGVLDGTSCTTNPGLVPYAAGLDDQPGMDVCLADLDAFDGAAAISDQVVPGYSSEDQGTYRRIVVNVVDPSTPGVASVAVVVSWTVSGRRASFTEFMVFYDPATIQTTVEM